MVGRHQRWNGRFYSGNNKWHRRIQLTLGPVDGTYTKGS
jgi:hypothetical protein